MKHTITVSQTGSSALFQRAAVDKLHTLSLKRLLFALTERFHRWRMLSRERYLLRTLSDDMLKDIGITRRDAEREAGRPFWDDRGIRR